MLFENLTEYQIEEYREIFKLFDKESEGVIKNGVTLILTLETQIRAECSGSSSQ